MPALLERPIVNPLMHRYGVHRRCFEAMLEKINRSVHADHSGDLSAAGTRSSMPPVFSLSSDPPDPHLGSSGSAAPTRSDLSGKRLLIRLDTTLYRSMDYSSPICPAPRNTELIVLDDCLGHDWIKVQIIEGPVGYLNRNHLLRRDQGVDPGTRMRRTVSGDTLESIMREAYPGLAGKVLDFRTVANVILHVNQDNPAISVSTGGIISGLANRIGHNYNRIVLREGHDLLLPSWQQVMSLKDEVASGSLSIGLIQSFWPDGWGCSLSLEAGLTFVALAGEAKLEGYFFRRGNHLAVHFSLGLAAGVSVGVGAGLMLRTKGKKRGIGAQAGADAELMGQRFGLLEFEIPLRAGEVLSYFRQLGGAFSGEQQRRKGAEEFTRGFAGDPLKYLSKAVARSGVRLGAQAAAGVGLMRAGSEAPTHKHGEGVTTTSYQASSGERAQRDKKIAYYRSTVGKKFAALREAGWKGVGIEVISDLIQSVLAIARLGGGVQAGLAYGLEYEKDQQGQRQTALFLEGYGWAELGLGPLPSMRIGAGIGIRYLFTQQPRTGKWTATTPEGYLFGGDLDSYTAGAYELSMGIGAADQGRESLLDRLRTVKFKKRFMVRFITGRLARRTAGLGRIRSLVSSDGRVAGLDSKVAMTFEVDLATLSTRNDDLQSDLRALTARSETGTHSELIESMLGDNAPQEPIRLLGRMLNSQTLSGCVFHAEGGLGLALSGRVGAGAKLQLDLAAGAGIVYERRFSGPDLFAALQAIAAESGINPEDHLADAIGGSQGFRNDFTDAFIAGAAKEELL